MFTRPYQTITQQILERAKKRKKETSFMDDNIKTNKGETKKQIKNERA